MFENPSLLVTIQKRLCFHFVKMHFLKILHTV